MPIFSRPLFKFHVTSIPIARCMKVPAFVSCRCGKIFGGRVGLQVHHRQSSTSRCFAKTSAARRSGSDGRTSHAVSTPFSSSWLPAAKVNATVAPARNSEQERDVVDLNLHDDIAASGLPDISPVQKEVPLDSEDENYPSVPAASNTASYGTLSTEDTEIDPEMSLAGDDEPLRLNFSAKSRKRPFQNEKVEADAIEKAEEVLSMDDASPEEMIEAFTRLMDINADRAGLALTGRIMQLVLHPNWAANDIASRIRNAKLTTVMKIREKIKVEVEDEMRKDGFVETVVENPEDNQLYTVVWLRDSLTVLSSQLQRAVMEGPCKNFHQHAFTSVNSRNEVSVSHPMTAEVAHSGIPHVKRYVMGHDEQQQNGLGRVSWTTAGDRDHAQSFVGLLQFYSDASSMTLSTNSLCFYPLQVTLLNFDQRTKDEIVAAGDAVIAYLSTDKTWRRKVDKALEVQRGFDGDDDDQMLNGEVWKAIKPRLNGSNPKRIPTEYKGCFEVRKEDAAYLHDSDSDDEGYVGAVEREIDDDDPEEFCGQAYLKRNQVEEIESQRIFAAMFRVCTKTLKGRALPGLIFRCSNGKLYKAHLPIASYVADSPEINHVACVKKGYCHRCSCDAEDLNGKNGKAFTASARDIRVTRRIHNDYEQARKNGDRKARTDVVNQFNDYHVHPMMPVISEWPFANLPGFGSYEVFRFDHMHSHPLGLCKHCLKVLHRRANEAEEKTNNDTKFDQEAGKFVWARSNIHKAIGRRNRIVLNACNWLLVSIDRDSPQKDFKVDHTRGKKVGRLNSVFTEEGLISMLEAKDYKSLTEVMPFLAALVDRLCNVVKEGNGPKWNDVEPLMTKFIVAYVDMDSAQTRRGRVDKSYTRADLQDIFYKKEAFRKLAVKPSIARYQPSGFNVEKFHKSDKHALVDILQLGFYAYYDSSVYESSHIVFKRLFRTTSQRVSTGMGEATRKMTLQSSIRFAGTTQLCPRDALVHSMVYGAPVSAMGADTSAKYKAKSLDHAVLSKWGKTFSLARLSMMMENVEIGTENWKTFLSVEGMKKIYRHGKIGKDYYNTNEFVRACGVPNFLAKPVCDILYKLSCLPFNHGSEIPEYPPPLCDSELYGEHGKRKSDVTFTMVTSAYTPCVNVPVLADIHKERLRSTVIRLRDTGERRLIRLISSNSWSHTNRRRKDDVLIEGVLDRKAGERVMWAAKVLAFIQCHAPYGYLANPRNQERAVVRYYEVVIPSALDRVDLALGCVKLKWAVGRNGDPWVDVVNADTIRGTFQAVPDGFHVLSEPENEAQEENAGTWKERRSYINRFKTYPDDEAYYLQNPDTCAEDILDNQ